MNFCYFLKKDALKQDNISKNEYFNKNGTKKLRIQKER